MTWNVFNALGFGAKPQWLVRITIGATVYTYAVSGSDVITTNGVPTADFVGNTTWLKSGISIGRINDSSVQEKRVVKVGLPRKLQIAIDILTLRTRTRVGVDIWQGFIGDPDNEYRRFFSGVARQKNPRYSEIILECFDELETFNNPALARAVQRPCPYAVYSDACGALRADHRVSGTATAINGLVVTVTEAGSSVDGLYNGGIIEFGSAEQRIRKHVGTQLTLHADVTGLADEIDNNGSASVNLLKGCRKSAQYCIDEFNNSINHGGFEDISNSPYTGDGLL